MADKRHNPKRFRQRGEVRAQQTNHAMRGRHHPNTLKDLKRVKPWIKPVKHINNIQFSNILYI